MVLLIAHQAVRSACSRPPRRSSADPHPPKKRGWPPAALPSLSRSRGLSRSSRRSPPEQPPGTALAPDLESTSVRHAKTPLTLLTHRAKSLFQYSVAHERSCGQTHQPPLP